MNSLAGKMTLTPSAEASPALLQLSLPRPRHTLPQKSFTQAFASGVAFNLFAPVSVPDSITYEVDSDQVSPVRSPAPRSLGGQARTKNFQLKFKYFYTPLPLPLPLVSLDA